MRRLLSIRSSWTSNNHMLATLRAFTILPASTYVLVLGQAINLTCAVIAVTVAAVLGAQLAATPALGTIPYGVQFAAVMLATYPASMLMKRFGRRPVFAAAGLVLVAAGAAGYVAAQYGSFAWLVVSHALLGLYIACANFYRFAAVDHIGEALRARALSLVVAGGVLAAILGPLLASSLREVVGHAEFALCYAAFSVLGVATVLLMVIWRPAQTPHSAASASVPSGTTSAPATPSSTSASPTSTTWQPLVLAIFCSAGGYLMMNLLMVQASLVMKGICSFDDASRAIQIHVLAMFVPSFFTGPLIARFGVHKVLTLGFVLLLAAAVYGTFEIQYAHLLTGLLLVGLGWNFTYVGGGALLAQSVAPHARHRWQGLNDTLIAACATLGAFLPAPMLAGFGWTTTNLLMVPFCVIGVLLCMRSARGNTRQ